MFSFYDKLIEGIVILNEEKKVVFVNKEIYDAIGWKNSKLNPTELNKVIKIYDDNNITIRTYNNKIIYGKYNWNEQYFKEKKYYVGIVNWEEDKVNLLNCLIRLVDSMEEWVCIRNIEDKFIFVNKACSNFYNMSKEETKRALECEVREGVYKDLIRKKDDYVCKRKESVTIVDDIERNGVLERYEIKKLPIIDQNGIVEYIAGFIREVTFETPSEWIKLDTSNIIYEGYGAEVRIDNYQNCLLENLNGIFESSFLIKGFNIWEFDNLNEKLRPYFYDELVSSNIKDIKEVDFKIESVQKYLNGTYKSVICSKDSDENKYYIIIFPIINGKEFLGLLTINYGEVPSYKVVRSRLIKTLCNQLAFTIKYIRISKRLIDELAISEKVRNDLSTLFEVVTDFVVKTDIEGKILDVSLGCVNLLGWPKEELIGVSCMELIHPDDLNITLKLMNDLLQKEEQEWPGHISRIRCVNGEYKKIIWISALYKKNGNYFIASGRDLTKEIELEKKENQMNEANNMQKLRNEFFSNLSHELKTPITLIVSVIQILEGESEYGEFNISNSNVKRYIKALKQNSYRVLRLVNNVIDTTKINAGFFPIHLKNINIICLVENIVMSVVYYCEHNKINITFNTEIEEKIITCDPDKIERVILNLLSNAIKYTEEGGNIFVEIKEEDEYISIYVKDTGIGMPKEKLEIIFTRFVQVENNEGKIRDGSGIGLSLVKSIVELHNGIIDVNSIEGKGTTFKVMLPTKKLEGILVKEDNILSRRENEVERFNIEFSDIYNVL